MKEAQEALAERASRAEAELNNVRKSQASSSCLPLQLPLPKTANRPHITDRHTGYLGSILSFRNNPAPPRDGQRGDQTLIQKPGNQFDRVKLDKIRECPPPKKLDVWYVRGHICCGDAERALDATSTAPVVWLLEAVDVELRKIDGVDTSLAPFDRPGWVRVLTISVHVKVRKDPIRGSRGGVLHRGPALANDFWAARVTRSQNQGN